jgi:hypothetical protein
MTLILWILILTVPIVWTVFNHRSWLKELKRRRTAFDIHIYLSNNDLSDVWDWTVSVKLPDMLVSNRETGVAVDETEALVAAGKFIETVSNEVSDDV